MKHLEEKLNALKTLENGWDGYKGKPATIKAVNSVTAFLEALSLVPGADGSIMIEAHVHGFDIEIDFNPDGTLDDAFLNIPVLSSPPTATKR